MNGGMRMERLQRNRFLSDCRNSLLILLLGVVLGALGKWSDYHNMLLANLTSGVQLWILLGCAVAVFSRTCWRAGLHVCLLLGGMVGAYYCTAELMGVPWSKTFLIGWAAAAVFAALPGFFVWFTRGWSLQAWLIRLGVLAVQALAVPVFSGRVNLPDVLLIAGTAAVLLWSGVEGGRRP